MKPGVIFVAACLFCLGTGFYTGEHYGHGPSSRRSKWPALTRAPNSIAHLCNALLPRLRATPLSMLASCHVHDMTVRDSLGAT